MQIQEREFFRAFLAALVCEGQGAIDARYNCHHHAFSRSAAYLVAQGFDEKDPLFFRGPFSGAYASFSQALGEATGRLVLPSIVGAYDLICSREHAQRILEATPEPTRSLAYGAAQAFCSLDRPPHPT